MPWEGSYTFQVFTGSVPFHVEGVKRLFKSTDGGGSQVPVIFEGHTIPLGVFEKSS